MGTRRLWCRVLAGLLGSIPAGLFGADTFGPIEVSLEIMPHRMLAHGYQTIVCRIANGDAERKHRVRLALEGVQHPPFVLAEVSREVEVSPGGRASVLLQIPVGPPAMFGECSVKVDGKKEGVLPVSFSAGRGMTRVGYSHGSAGMQELEILVGQRVSRDAMADAFGGAFLSPAERETAAWPTRWSAYSAYDMVVVDGQEWRLAPEPVRDALWRYAECGGTLLVMGECELPVPCRVLEVLPGRRSSRGSAESGMVTIYEAVLGRCAVSQFDTGLPQLAAARLAQHALGNSQAVCAQLTTADMAHSLAPVLKELSMKLGVPFLVLSLFALVAGPVNLIWLRRRNRGIWLFWITPVLGVGASAAVFVSVIASEGLTSRARIEGMTVLDERVGRATTFGVNGYYCPLRPRDGLAYSYDTEVTACLVQGGGMAGGGGAGRVLVWDEEQHLSENWVQPRVPQYFRVRASELRQERLGLVRGDSGLAVVNGLGAVIEQLFLVDHDGTVYEANGIEAGEQASLGEPSSRVMPSPRTLSDAILRNPRWGEAQRDGLPWSGVLRPGTYLACLRGAPFVPNGLRQPAEAKESSAVLGIMRKEDRP